jgi:glycine amidinotransferase
MERHTVKIAAKTVGCPVSTWNEWDPLEEVIVGTALDAHQPTESDPLSEGAQIDPRASGKPFPAQILSRCEEQIERFVAILAAEGVKVLRPTPFDLSSETVTPFFSAPCGFNFMNARDLVLVVGDQIIEAPTAGRTRYFETLAFRPIFKDYFRRGARWISAPKPELGPNSFNSLQVRERLNLQQEVTSEHEPLFDAADFVRCGRDLFCQRGALTNRFGIEWLRRHLGDRFRVHEIQTRCKYSVHIDTTFVPLGPGRVLVNPNWIGTLPDVVNGWEIVEAPEPEQHTVELLPGVRQLTSEYIALNVFLLDEKRVFVEWRQKKLIKILKERGMHPIDIPFDLPPFLGGAFHCVTLDIRRKGELKSYARDV